MAFRYQRLPRGGWRRRARGWKYELTEDYLAQVYFVYPKAGRGVACDEWISLNEQAWLRVAKGYAWDGPSGPTFDTETFMRGSLVHDALYQLIRAGELVGAQRKGADLELRRVCREDGMNPIRAWWVYWVVRMFGWLAAR